MREKRASLWIPAVGLAAFFFHLGGYWSATWWSKWFVLTLGFECFFAMYVARKTSWWYAPILLTALVSSTAMAFWAQKIYSSEFDPLIEIVLQKDALFAWITVVASTLFFANWKSEWAYGGRIFLTSLWAIGITVFTTMPRGMPPNNGWQFGNPSMAGCLLAVLLPYIWQKVAVRLQLVATFLTVLVAWRLGASQPIGVLAVVIFVGLKNFPLRLSMIGALIFGGFHFLGRDFLDNNGRFEIYHMAWNWSRSHGLFWTGWGAGSAQTVMPLIQLMKDSTEKTFFLWLHSDWLQILIEYGVFGFVFSLLAFGKLAHRAATQGNACDQAALWGFAAMALFNYPLRTPLTFFCLLMVCCFIQSSSESTAQTDAEIQSSANTDRRAPVDTLLSSFHATAILRDLSRGVSQKPCGSLNIGDTSRFRSQWESLRKLHNRQYKEPRPPESAVPHKPSEETE
jgi:hypothetical protein